MLPVICDVACLDSQNTKHSPSGFMDGQKVQGVLLKNIGPYSQTMFNANHRLTRNLNAR